MTDIRETNLRDLEERLQLGSFLKDFQIPMSWPSIVFAQGPFGGCMGSLFKIVGFLEIASTANILPRTLPSRITESVLNVLRGPTVTEWLKHDKTLILVSFLLNRLARVQKIYEKEPQPDIFFQFISLVEQLHDDDDVSGFLHCILSVDSTELDNFIDNLVSASKFHKKLMLTNSYRTKIFGLSKFCQFVDDWDDLIAFSTVAPKLHRAMWLYCAPLFLRLKTKQIDQIFKNLADWQDEEVDVYYRDHCIRRLEKLRTTLLKHMEVPGSFLDDFQILPQWKYSAIYDAVDTYRGKEAELKKLQEEV